MIIMIKDLIKYALVAILLSGVTWLFSLVVARAFNLDKTNSLAIEDLLFVLVLIPAFLKLRFFDLQDVISVNRFSWGMLIVSFICMYAMSYAIDMLVSLFNISIEEQSQMEMDIVRHPFTLFTTSFTFLLFC